MGLPSEGGRWSKEMRNYFRFEKVRQFVAQSQFLHFDSQAGRGKERH